MTARDERPLAAIDVGTNTALLLVARIRDGELQVIEDRCESPRLGQGLARSGQLEAEPVERTLRALELFSERLRAHEVAPERVRAVGTACLRRAANPERLLEPARVRAGLTIEVVSEEEEAQLGFRAVTGDGAANTALVLDVGGGSSELVSDRGQGLVSAPVGAVVLTESHLGLDGEPPAGEPGWEALLSAARAALACMPAGVAAGGATLYALGGTPSNLACLDQGLGAFDPERAEGWRLPAARAMEFAERLRGLSLEERRALPIEPQRAEVLPAGLACVGLAAERLGASELLVSGRGLRYGVVRAMGQQGCPGAS